MIASGTPFDEASSESAQPKAEPKSGCDHGVAGLFAQMPWGNTADCALCPFGIAIGAVRNAKPEVMEHLFKAGMEIALAFKVIVESAAERLGHEPKDNDDGMQRITIT